MDDRFEEVSALFTKCFEHYYATQCQCAFPRHHQIISIDCVDTGDACSRVLLHNSPPAPLLRSDFSYEWENAKERGAF